jgi:hypothetical protein
MQTLHKGVWDWTPLSWCPWIGTPEGLYADWLFNMTSMISFFKLSYAHPTLIFSVNSVCVLVRYGLGTKQSTQCELISADAFGCYLMLQPVIFFYHQKESEVNEDPNNRSPDCPSGTQLCWRSDLCGWNFANLEGHLSGCVGSKILADLPRCMK